jgi:hypothetical protein
VRQHARDQIFLVWKRQHLEDFAERAVIIARDIRTLRRWRESRRGPSFLKIGGRYFYTIGALRDFYQRSIRGGAG